jgi:hypothetical protein
MVGWAWRSVGFACGDGGERLFCLAIVSQKDLAIGGQGRAGALAGCAEVLWLSVRTGRQAFGFELLHMGSILLGQPHSYALAFHR